jgi:hypothetical protein
MNLNDRRIATMRIVGTVAALAVTAFLASPAPAQEKAGPGGAPKMPSEEEMMKAWMAVATPGEAHKKLEPIVGTFDVKTTSWMAPGKPPEESTGTSENKWILGNRYVEQTVSGTMMGQTFSGVGFTGYDNYKKKYVGTWMDTMGTMIMMSTGTMDASGKKLTSWSVMDDVVAKKPAKIKSLLTILDNDHHKFEMWGPGPDGKTLKVLEINYTRTK